MARRARPVGNPDRAVEAEVVEVQDGPCAGGRGGGERPPAEQGMQVVGVDDEQYVELNEATGKKKKKKKGWLPIQSGS